MIDPLLFYILPPFAAIRVGPLLLPSTDCIAWVMAVALGKRKSSSRRSLLAVSTSSRTLFALCLLWTILLWFGTILQSSEDFASSSGNLIDHKEWTVNSAYLNSDRTTVVSAANQTIVLAGAESSSAARTLPDHRKWAYAFVVGGVLNPDTEYRGFLYSVAAATKQLRDASSRADVVLFVQISYKATETKLPAEEEKLLQSLDIKIRYIPKFASEVHEKFYGLMMEKFRILSLTEYSRVLFLDSDVMPVCSLDYIFELSDPPKGVVPKLKENVVLAQKSEPSHGGFFMLQPSVDNYAEVLQILRRREEEALAMNYPYWDEKVGWGHVFSDSEYWRAPTVAKGLNWDWHGSFADQGLIYFYTKYAKQSVSFIIWSEVENWGLGQNNTLQIESTMSKHLNQFSCKPPNKDGEYRPVAPYRDYVHFTGRGKPWHQEYEKMEAWLADSKDFSKDKRLIWYSALKRAIENSGATIPMDFFGNRVSVGVAPGANEMYKHLVDKRRRGWSSYSQEHDVTAPSS